MMKNVPNYCHIEDMKDEPKKSLGYKRGMICSFYSETATVSLSWQNIWREKKKRHKKITTKQSL